MAFLSIASVTTLKLHLDSPDFTGKNVTTISLASCAPTVPLCGSIVKSLLKFGAVVGVASAVLASAPAFAQDKYTILIGYGFGGTYGKYARTMADHLRNYIPGGATIVVQSMPGAGGLKATNYASKVMPNNGKWIFIRRIFKSFTMPADKSKVFIRHCF